MNKEELAKLIDGSEYRFSPSKEFISHAEKNRLVIIYGQSDDLMELRGAIDDECGCLDGGIFKIDGEGVLPDWGSIEAESDAEHFFTRKKKAKVIKALWCEEPDYSWTYETEIPHACFDILEDGEKYCRGIVIDLKDL